YSGKGGTFYSYTTYEEYVATSKEMDDFLLHPPGWDDPNMYKEESAEICQECFPIIQKTFPETLLMKTNATHFYCSASVSEYDCRKCIDCVLDNLKYAQSLEMNVPLTVKELVKDITQKAKDFNNFSKMKHRPSSIGHHQSHGGNFGGLSSESLESKKETRNLNIHPIFCLLKNITVNNIFDFSQVEMFIQVQWCNLTVAESVEEIAKGLRNSGNVPFKTKSSCIGLD
ncbi:hypothetical protein KSS87_008717, partial [Heliosperma pusillum]